MSVGFKAWDTSGKLITGIDDEFLKIEGFINVPSDLQGEHQFSYQPSATPATSMPAVAPPTTSVQAVFFAVQTQLIDSYAIPLVIKNTPQGMTYYHADNHANYSIQDGNTSLAKRCAWRIYYGWLHG